MATAHLNFIGAGNMARAILGGLIANGYQASSISACAPNSGELDSLKAEYPINTSLDNNAFIDHTDVLLLCTKPQVLKAACEGIRDSVQARKPLIVSIAAGVTIAQIEEWLGGDLPVVRCMPNTPALVHIGASGLFANSRVSPEQKNLAASLFESVGLVAWVPAESDLHTVTALSGSGPAYCFMFIEAMEKAAIGLGLNAADARALAIQTMRGAAELASRSEESPEQLKRRVMSPGGTTERAVSRFEQEKLAEVVAAAIGDAWSRSYELAGEEPPA
ncbi:pyrroline-5-carboxylate reductase [Hahella sp. CCB-MM4]|uniref:pyrroline-5-carboxylate reductase n=1 Tax=Hahella sp. (strain CCB-MM4) TaxID=1926491 RepID=UPI000B9B5E84|nr:pyrroline-5-carboxylate reductase [Hahella sp. CCB-MM4]OZG74260.1 pyrroline-5-carboxylate reductase [Hahella sp. CCB-MM4]